jgi:hypothetical protein
MTGLTGLDISGLAALHPTARGAVGDAPQVTVPQVVITGSRLFSRGLADARAGLALTTH